MAAGPGGTTGVTREEHDVSFDADRTAPQAARSWLAESVVLDPTRLAEAQLLVSEVVTASVVAADDGDDVVATARRTTTSWVVSIEPAPVPDQLSASLLDRFSNRWGRDGSRVWFEVRAPGSGGEALSRVGLEDLLGRVGDDVDAREEVIRRLTPMAVGISRGYRGKGIGDEDLEQAAVLGLVRALDRYDPDAGVFERYAASTVSGEMKRLLRDRAWSVRIPRGVKRLSLEVRRASQALGQRLGREPTASEVAEDLDVEVDDVIRAMGASSGYRARSIDEPIGTSGWQLSDTLGEEDDRLELAEKLGDLAPAVASLAPRERRIIRLRFVDELTQSEIAERIGVSQMQISRLIRRSLADLREAMDA